MKYHFGKSRSFALSLSAMAIAQAAPVYAQTVAQPVTEGTSPSGGGIVDIVVTAEKRKANLQDVPLSVTAIGGDALQAAGATSARNLDGLVSGVKVQGVNSPAVFVRGVGTSNSSGTGDQGVALHLDGVFQARPTAFAAGFVDVERVEVLKGPQGTLYGRGALGGNVNVISKEPTDQFEGSAGLTIGNYRQLTATAVANVPISDDLAIRAAIQTDRHDSYSKPVGDDLNSFTGRLRLKYELAAGVKIGLTLFHTERDGDGSAYQRARSYTGYPRQKDQWDNAIDNDQYVHAKTTELSGQIDIDLGGATLTYIPAYSWDRYKGAFPSLVYLPTPFMVDSITNSDMMTHEVRLASGSGGRLEWTIGGFYMDEKIDYLLDYQPFVTTYGKFETESVSAFGQASLELVDGLRLIGGIRQNRDTKTQDTNFGNHFHKSWNSTTGRLGFEWKPARENLIYLTASEGFKAGGFFTAPGDNSFDPERMRSYELGTKNRFFDNHLQLNAALFWNKYRNYQANANVPGYNGSITQGVINAGKARLRGFEVETLIALGSADRIDASVTYVDSEFTELKPTTTTAKVGDALPYSPKWSGNAGYQHIFGLASGATLTARAESHFESKSWLSLNHRQFTGQKGFTKSSATLTYAAAGDRYSVAVWLRNIENEAVKTTVADTLGFENYVLAPPRTFGATLAAKF